MDVAKFHQLPAGFLVGVNYAYVKGRPFGRLVAVTDIVGIPTRILAEPINGDRSLDNQSLLDMRVQKHFSFGKDARIALFVDALNLTNSSAGEAIARSISKRRLLH